MDADRWMRRSSGSCAVIAATRLRASGSITKTISVKSGQIRIIVHIHQAAGSVNRPQRSSRHTIKRPVAPAKGIGNRTCAAKRPSIASNSAYLFGAICPARGVGAAFASLCRHRHDATPPQRNLEQHRQGRTRRGASRQGRVAHHQQARHARKHHTDLPAFAVPGVEPGRERLAVSPSELDLKHRLRKLRRHCRRCLRRMAETDRPARNDHLHRNARLGSRRSVAL